MKTTKSKTLTRPSQIPEETFTSTPDVNTRYLIAENTPDDTALYW